MKTLELTFKGSLGGKHVFKVHNAKPDLKEETILPVMKSLAALKLFQHSDEFLYEQPVSAKYVDVQETVVFDNSPHTTELNV
ncbi:DUF2922 domain-containing protein [Limosilactobacillus mucosae]|jgi:hypothetical protein|uniref:DUF2922 domain-containing protein n=1 Tax=Limosilactobacillus mucosae TaxID=97478 RepID=A0A7L9VNA4_LIMMU|nr:DUF2922 domain-containing protein [Limosilactobacillus mucosae]QOL68857.1 DUF2922 domain-containing protein [Limosilactobacillus mucosae]